MASAASDRHIVIFPTPGMGHLIPLLQFANEIINRHRFTATFIIPTDGPLSTAQSAFLNSLTASLDYILLPAVKLDDLSQDSKIETRICVTVARSIPALRDAVKSLIHGGKNVLAFVADLFGTDGFEVALELGLSPYLFFPASATTFSFLFHLPEIDKSVDCEYSEMNEKLRIPGCMPMNGMDLVDPVQDRKNDAYKWLLHICKKYRMAEGIIINSFYDLEPGPIPYLQKQEPGKPSIYAVGPLIRSNRDSDDKIEESPCLKWLNEQPIGSVLFVSFGSGGTLSHDQIIELAHGLVISDQKFIWVLRCPSSSVSNAEYFRLQNSTDPLAYLPEGFLEKTRHKGLVLPSWAPQTEILGHPSTGAFLSHCGWNSILESVVNGVPVIAWPLFAEQKMNAVMLHEDVKIALRPTMSENGLVKREEIAKVIKNVMEEEEGKTIKRKTRNLKDAAARAIGNGGDSIVAIDQLARKWTSTDVKGRHTVEN